MSAPEMNGIDLIMRGWITERATMLRSRGPIPSVPVCGKVYQRNRNSWFAFVDGRVGHGRTHTEAVAQAFKRAGRRKVRG